MRPRVVAASAATFFAAASLSPVAAQAAGQNTLYVNGSNSACTDTGTGAGTYAAPYCTIQAAADAANPGDVVNVAPGTYAAATVTRSGTASAPIVFNGNGVFNSIGLSNAAMAPLSFSGASHVRVQNFWLAAGSTTGTVIDGGSDLTFHNDIFRFLPSAAPALHITGSASGVTVVQSGVGPIVVDAGSSDTVLTTDRIIGGYANPVSVIGASATAITSDTISGCGPEISVTGSATGTSIENNVLALPTTSNSANCPASTVAENLLVDASSAPGTTADYNNAYNAAGSAIYDWAGAAYASASAFHTATGQGGHDGNSLLGTEVLEHSPLINSADSAAIGEQSTDLYGHPRTLDPLVAPTGAGPYNDYDRGAIQFQDPVTKVSSSLTTSTGKVPVGSDITFNASVTDTWSDAFDYQLKLSNGSTIDAGTSGKATASLATPGTYTATLYATPLDGAGTAARSYNSAYFVVSPYTTLTPAISDSASGAYGVDASDYGTTDGWNITGVSFDFGDGTPAQATTDGVAVQHIYAKAGTYTITETVTDEHGDIATTSTKFTTDAIVAGTLIVSPSVATPSGNVPAGSTGLAQVATTALPNGSGELLAVTTAGALEFSTSNAGATTWNNWQTLTPAPGVTTTWAGLAGMPNGTTQLIEVTSAGKLLHTVRNANGTWQSTGWGSPRGSTGFVHASIAALPDGSAQLVAVTTAGVLMHNIRYANGSWQGWRAVSQPGVTIVDAAIGGLLDGSSQIVEVTSAGVLKHDVRNYNGSWQASGWGTPKGTPSVSQVSIGGGPVFAGSYWDEATISIVTKSGGEMTDTRNYDGSWSGWWGDSSGIGDAGIARDSTYAYLPTGYYLAFTVTGG